MGDPAGDIETAQQTTGEFFWIEIPEIFKTDKRKCFFYIFLTGFFIFYVQAAEVRIFS